MELSSPQGNAPTGAETCLSYSFDTYGDTNCSMSEETLYIACESGMTPLIETFGVDLKTKSNFMFLNVE